MKVLGAMFQKMKVPLVTMMRKKKSNFIVIPIVSRKRADENERKARWREKG